MLKLIRRALQVIGVVLIIGLIISGSAALLDYIEKEADKAADLSFDAGNTVWKWQVGFREVQFAMVDGETRFRLVNREKSYVVHVQKPSHLSFLVSVMFYTQCTPNSVIDTGQRFADGAPILLMCSKDGDRLVYLAKYDVDVLPEYDWDLPELEEDFGGFSFATKLGYIDFTQRDQEITLSKAKVPNE